MKNSAIKVIIAKFKMIEFPNTSDSVQEHWETYLSITTRELLSYYLSRSISGLISFTTPAF